LKDKIVGLIQLQDCDNRINDIITRKTEGPLRIEKLDDEVNALEKRFQEENDRLGLIKKDRRQIEQDLQEIENNIEKSEIKLASIKSNKEYRAVLKEIDDLNNKRLMTEEKVLKLMEEIEDLERKCKKNRDQEAEFRKKYELDRDEILNELKYLDRELENFEKQRINICETIDQDLLNRYIFLRERKGGQAIGPVVSGVCQLCHMGIPPQKFNDLRKGQDLMSCPNCNRMIYWGDDEHYQEVINKA
jgi:predicted  nucleic acid-binding Zn-ribbon protein